MSAKTMKNITRVITILFFVTMLLSAFSMVFGTVTIPTPSQPGTGGEDINGIVSNVIWIIQTIAIAAAVIMLMFVGIKFVTASPEGKADICSWSNFITCSKWSIRNNSKLSKECICKIKNIKVMC